MVSRIATYGRSRTVPMPEPAAAGRFRAQAGRREGGFFQEQGCGHPVSGKMTAGQPGWVRGGSVKRPDPCSHGARRVHRPGESSGAFFASCPTCRSCSRNHGCPLPACISWSWSWRLPRNRTEGGAMCGFKQLSGGPTCQSVHHSPPKFVALPGKLCSHIHYYASTNGKVHIMTLRPSARDVGNDRRSASAGGQRQTQSLPGPGGSSLASSRPDRRPVAFMGRRRNDTQTSARPAAMKRMALKDAIISSV